MSVYLVATIKSWNIEHFEKLKAADTENEWHLITDKRELTAEKVKEINPRYIFFPHWSWIIKPELHDTYECIVFHMTDLPYGRGGSPLQNLIVRGHTETKISALKVEAGMDTGDIYMKRDLSLEGSATDIFKRASDVIFSLIKEIVETHPEPVAQRGEVTEFTRRTEEQSNMKDLSSTEDVYNHIRMLDAEGYPKAYVEIGGVRVEFDQVQKDGEKLNARATIIKKVD